MEEHLESHPEEIVGIKEALENSGFAEAALRVQKLLKEKNIPLQIAITGESGAGKSSFVNALCGLDDEDDRAARTGAVETTSVASPYSHQNYPGVTFWDLPGIGTTNFPADEYLELVGFEKFDFFIIISDTRFRENDVKLAQEIQKMKKNFYFVRSKIDKDIRAEERSQRDYNMDRTLSNIKKNCIQGLEKQGIKSSRVFLVSSLELHQYDFPLLKETLQRELSEHKIDVLLFVICKSLNKKKETFEAKIAHYATLSAAIRFAPLGISSIVDSILKAVIIDYVTGFGLDSSSLERLALATDVPYTDLFAVINSPLAENPLTTDLILNEFTKLKSTAKLVVADNVCRFIPLFGSVLSFNITSQALHFFLSELADDAERVFKRALNLTTSVWYC